MKTSKVPCRQSLALWEIHRVIPDEFKEKMTAHEVTKLQAIIPVKIERSFAMTIGSELEDEEGRTWLITSTKAFMKNHDSKRKGKAPIAVLTLKKLEY